MFGFIDTMRAQVRLREGSGAVMEDTTGAIRHGTTRDCKFLGGLGQRVAAAGQAGVKTALRCGRGRSRAGGGRGQGVRGGLHTAGTLGATPHVLRAADLTADTSGAKTGGPRARVQASGRGGSGLVEGRGLGWRGGRAMGRTGGYRLVTSAPRML